MSYGCRRSTRRWARAIAALWAGAVAAACSLAVGSDSLSEGCGEGTKACDGECVSTSDPSVGCGQEACGPCVFDNAVARCNRAECDMAGCRTGYGDCNDDAGDGCEVDTRTDPEHCSECFARCPTPPNGEPDCASGRCVIRRCDEGFKDCNRDFSDGCEIDATSSAEHCGGCDQPCDEGDRCVSGTCEP